MNDLIKYLINLNINEDTRLSDVLEDFDERFENILPKNVWEEVRKEIILYVEEHRDNIAF